nr:arylesterase [Motiliproteus sp. SC1-56]
MGACDTSPSLPPLANDAVILAFGDSLTRGTVAPEAQSYPTQLAQLSGRTVINAGRPGELSAEGLARLPALLERHQPDLLLLCHGGNDWLRKRPPQQLAANLKAMIALAREQNIPVLLIGVPRLSLLVSTADLYQTLADELEVAYEDEALAEILADNRLKSDPIHPNGEGYRRLAQAVYTRLQTLGAL